MSQRAQKRLSRRFSVSGCSSAVVGRTGAASAGSFSVAASDAVAVVGFALVDFVVFGAGPEYDLQEATPPEIEPWFPEPKSSPVAEVEDSAERQRSSQQPALPN